jgi:predicted transcriptional regulator
MPKPTIPCARRERDTSGARGLTVTLPVVVTEETAARLDRVAEEYGVNRTDVQRKCIDEYLPELERWIENEEYLTALERWIEEGVK